MTGKAALGSSVRTKTTAPARLPLVATAAALPRLLWAFPDSPIADRKLLARLATETGARTAPPAPSLHEYVAMVAQDVFHRLFGWIHLPNISFAGLGPVLLAVGFGLAVLLLTGALFLIARFLLAAINRRSENVRSTHPTASASPVPPAPPSEAAYWWRRFRAALNRRDAITAMESLWFWVAVRLTGAAADPSWTSRELLDQAKRDDLRPAMTQLDGWRFGPIRPAPEKLENLATQLGEVLG